ncbi:MAG: hypothetical protein DDT32_01738 [Syntrophomonadaceae bacterium]|nr:hypothetical protein [Bacillota bacterium]
MLSQALAEVSGILKTCGLRQGVTVLSVDTQVQTSSRVFDARQIKLRGGGGTDMGAGLTAAVKLMPRPQLAIVLTDGYTPWPTNKPSGLKHVIIGLLDEGTVSSPSWAKNIQIRF